MTKQILLAFLSTLMAGCHYLPEETCYGPSPGASEFRKATSERSDDIKSVPPLASQEVLVENEGEDLSIRKITNWVIAYHFDRIELKNVPVDVDETRSYEFNDLSILLKDRVLSVQNVATGESRDVAQFPYTTEIADSYLGWATSNDSALLYKLADSPQWTLHRFDPDGDLSGTKGSLPPGDYQWLQGPNHLAYTPSSESSDTIADYLDVEGGLAKRVSVQFKNLSSDPYLNKYSYYLRENGTLHSLGSIEATTYYSPLWPAISPDGNQLFLDNAASPDAVLLDLNTLSVSLVNHSRIPFTPIPYPVAPRPTSFDGRLSASISNETQTWSATLKLTVKGRDKEIVDDRKADRLTYQYDWIIQKGDSFAKESGTVDVGYSPGGCYYDD